MSVDFEESFDDFLHLLKKRKARAKSLISRPSKNEKHRRSIHEQKKSRTRQNKERIQKVKRTSIKSVPNARRRWIPGGTCRIITQQNSIRKTELEFKRQRNQLRVLKQNRDSIKVENQKLSKKYKNQVVETKFWIDKAELALRRTRELKLILVKFKRKQKTSSSSSKQMRSRRLDYRYSTSQLFSTETQTRPMKNFKEDFLNHHSHSVDTDRVNDLEKKLQRSFQNYRALKKSHERLVVEYRHLKRENHSRSLELEKTTNKLKQEHISNLDLERSISVMHLKSNQLKTLAKKRNYTVSTCEKDCAEKQQILNRNKADQIDLIPCTSPTLRPKTTSTAKSKLLRFVSRREPEKNLILFDKFQKLRHMNSKA